MKSIGKEVLYSIILSVVIWLLAFGLNQTESTAQLVHPQINAIIIFSAFLGIIVVLVGRWGMKVTDQQSRPNVFLGLTVLRLLLSMAFIGIMLFTGIEQRILWVANFFAIYLFYLVFEILSILSNLRAISAEDEKP